MSPEYAMPPRSRKIVSFFAGIVAARRGVGYGYASRQWNMDFEAMKMGWRFAGDMANPIAALRWKLHTCRVMNNKRSWLTGRTDLRSAWRWIPELWGKARSWPIH